MTKTKSFVLGLAGAAVLLTAACSGQTALTKPAGSEPAGNAASTASHGKVLLDGDSVAEQLAQPLAAAAAASQVEFQSVAADGGGNVVGPDGDEQLQDLTAKISAAKPSVVVYQITTYDWGSEQEQETAYTKLVKAASDAGAKLAFVTMPPIKTDDFYAKHEADMKRTTSVAHKVADASGEKATVLDANAVWGDSYQQMKDGKPDRSSDGIHTCPQGAARYTNWLLPELAKMIPGMTPAPAASWANAGWAGDTKHFKNC